MPDTITIHTDQGALQVAPHTTLHDAVELLLRATHATQGSVATAVNGQFVPRAAREQLRLQDGDTVLCFSPITGG